MAKDKALAKYEAKLKRGNFRTCIIERQFIKLLSRAFYVHIFTLFIITIAESKQAFNAYLFKSRLLCIYTYTDENLAFLFCVKIKKEKIIYIFL